MSELPQKKPRLLNDDPNGDPNERKLIEELLKKAKKTKNVIFPVLSKEVSRKEVPLTSVWVDRIIDKQHISRLIQEMNSIRPIPSLQHLKRVRDGKFLLLELDVNIEDGDQCISRLRLDGLDIRGLEARPFLIRVPKVTPKTRTQYKHANSIWPCNFHEDKYLESIISGEIFSQEERQFQALVMKKVMQKAKLSHEGVAAAIVNPEKHEILVVCKDLRDQHPIWHAVMRAIDAIAESQGGGAWALNKNKQKPVEKESGIYLCTGYDIYVSREPCIMCSMALVHSRIRRVFFGDRYIKGGLATNASIHTLPQLNHHFEVWGGL